MATTRVRKNSSGYGYKYTDMAEIHKWLERNHYSYYQTIETMPDGTDYIWTVPIIDGVEQPPRRGCRVIQASLSGKQNPAQEQGSGLTYARRYSLLMAFGLATDDDDAESLSDRSNAPIIAQQIGKIRDELNRTGLEEETILQFTHKAKLEDLTQADYAAVIKKIAKNKTKGAD